MQCWMDQAKQYVQHLSVKLSMQLPGSLQLLRSISSSAEQLQSLSITSSTRGDLPGAISFASLSHLTSLELRGYRQISDATMESIAKLPQLRTLHFSELNTLPMHISGLSLSALTNISSLALTYCNLTLASSRAVCALGGNLKSLDLTSSTIFPDVDPGVHGNQGDGPGMVLASISPFLTVCTSLTALTRLDLSSMCLGGCHLNRNFTTLSALTALEELQMQGTRQRAAM